MRRILILGGGAAGALLANLLVHQLVDYETEITVVSATPRHAYQPAWLYVPFGRMDARKVAKPLRRLLHPRIQLVIAEARELNTHDQRVTLSDERILDYDFLVIATGCRVCPDEVPGLSIAGHHFYTHEAASRLFGVLQDFSGGRLLVGIGGSPCKCPVAPLEFVFLLDEFLVKRGLREVSDLTFVSPWSRPSEMDSVSELVGRLFQAKGIHFEGDFQLLDVIPKDRLVRSTGNRNLKFDLLVMIPPHRGAEFLQGQPISDAQGWVQTDPHRLQVRGHTAIWAMGDAADLPVSKAGSATHFQAPAVVEQIVAAIQHRQPDPRKAEYSGHTLFFLETGHGRATFIDFDYRRAPRVEEPNLFMHYMKQALGRSYFHLVPTGVI